MRSRPALITVVMPVLNGEAHIGEQLAALVAQTYQGRWEVVLANNGCTDRTLEIARSWMDRLPALRVADARDHRSVNHARNTGAVAARGDFLAFCDADDVVDPDWLEGLVEAAGEADIVVGVRDLELLNDPICRSWVPQLGTQALAIRHGFLPAASGGNCGMWASVARELRWNGDFVSGSADIEFSWRAQLAGYRIALAPGAVLHQRCRPRLRELARQWYGYGYAKPQLYREFRSEGMLRPDVRSALSTWGWLVRNMLRAFRHPRFRGNWVRLAAGSLGNVAGSLRTGVLFIEAPALPRADED